MKINLAYPKIPDTFNCPLKQCIAFEKYDGTNIYWVFNSPYGFTDFGTRRDRFPLNNTGIKQFEQTHPELSSINKLLDYKLESYLTNNYPNSKEIIIFTEYFGPNSFAGSHNPNDKKQLIIFDVQVDGKIIPPKEFIIEFKDFNIARVIFQGKYSGQLFVDIRNNKYNIKEGAVIKGMVDDQIYMAKVKTEEYMQKLKDKFKDSWEDYWE